VTRTGKKGGAGKSFSSRTAGGVDGKRTADMSAAGLGPAFTLTVRGPIPVIALAAKRLRSSRGISFTAACRVIGRKILEFSVSSGAISGRASGTLVALSRENWNGASGI